MEQNDKRILTELVSNRRNVEEEKLDVISIKLFNIKYNDLINKDRDIVFKQYLKENAI